MNNLRGPRLSLGGQTVRDSLQSLGYLDPPDGTVLTETVNPVSRPRVVLAQNAWNFIPRSRFVQEIAPYPRAMQFRAVARRMVALQNARSAQKIICMTDSFGTLVERVTDSHVVVSPVTVGALALGLPSKIGHTLTREDIDTSAVDEPYVLVPGTVTWFKRSSQAIDVVQQLFPHMRHVLFAGGDDGSGCWDSVVSRSRGSRIAVSRRRVGHVEMIDLLSRSYASVLPSGMESLGFSLSESLLFADRVVASSLESHREIAQRVGREPDWLPSRVSTLQDRHAVSITDDIIRTQWHSLAATLGY